ncbi:NgoMIV family type II restriction endonuclease [Oscillatoria sp. HE19RPO]|uniref:NgoMIV family type II restriction endonuclease n=1 Tax=Oscillatoria sp. HE19RPO TaxID=2954806 RepID=UPI0020C522A8|nr:NgoMIV family type II restriction endonuclease [Oscillatoria sp. HE19RPO]
MSAYFSQARKTFHLGILTSLLRLRDNSVPSFADKHSRLSCDISQRIVTKLEGEMGIGHISGQTSGKVFEDLVLEFLAESFTQIADLRPGNWKIQTVKKREKLFLSQFEQYAHLLILDQAARANPQLAASLGNDYMITPDIVMFRWPEPDSNLNAQTLLVDDESVTYASLRAKNQNRPILHGSISCKWTIRSDRSQNSRTEALNLIRNRKGRSPHIVVVTAEPLPSRLASIALGTGDIDCVYHFALYELIAAVQEGGWEDATEMLRILVEGKRLRDISDLPLDLAI